MVKFIFGVLFIMIALFGMMCVVLGSMYVIKVAWKELFGVEVSYVWNVWKKERK